jgi:hypothetical protein
VTIFVGWRTNGFCNDGRDGSLRAIDDDDTITVAMRKTMRVFTNFFMR